MRYVVKLLASAVCLMVFGCATAPERVYVTEAQQVTTQALEPVNLDSVTLASDVSTKFSGQLSPDMAGILMNVVKEEIAKTKRFTKVVENASDGENYIIEPSIESVSDFESPLPADPTRKLATFKARVRLDVKFMNQKGQVELVKSYSDNRVKEIKISTKEKLTLAKKQKYYEDTIVLAFKAASDRLGNGFNPSYEMGVISRLNGKTANIQINTSKIRKMPKKQQSVEVIDDDNKVLATIAELVVEDGSITGKMYEKSGASIKEGSKVRAKVNALTD